MIITMTRKQRTPEERAEQVQALKRELDGAVERLSGSDDYLSYLRFVSSLGTRYSAGNTILLWEQAMMRGTDVTAVASYGAWAKRGRQVRKGERGYQVFAPCKYRMTDEHAAHIAAQTGKPVKRDDNGKLPMVTRGFRVEHVFDVSQTDGEPLPANPALPSLLTGEDVTGAQTALEKLVAGDGFTFGIGETLPANGWVSWWDRTVRVGEHCQPAQRAKSTAHELAHIRCGHETADYDRPRRECEAESVAFIVCGALGADTSDYSVGYVTSWAGGSGGAEVLRAIADTVTSTARGILDDLETVATEPVEYEWFCDACGHRERCHNYQGQACIGGSSGCSCGGFQGTQLDRSVMVA